MSDFDPTALSPEDQAGLQAILNAIPEKDDTEPANRYTTSNGIVLELKPIPPLLINDAQNNLKPPKPPRVPNLDKDPDGKVLEENLNDPTFIEEQKQYRANLAELSNAIFLTRGTKVLSAPEHIEKVESTDWSDDLKDLAGLAIPDSGRRRYYCWLKYVALANIGDLTSVLRKVSNLAGVTLEADVAQATADFPGDSEGNTADGVRPAAEDGRGNSHLSLVTGTGPGTGVSGSGPVLFTDVAKLDEPDSAGTS